MNFRDDIIIPSWNLISLDSKVKSFYFLPGILSILFLTFVLTYQSIYTYVVLFNKKSEALNLILKFFHSDYLVEVLILGFTFLILYILLVPIFEWGLIKYIDERNKKWPDEVISSFDMLWVWLYKFLPLFEYDQMFSKFKFIAVLNFYLLVLRFVWVAYLKEITYFFLSIFFIFSILNMFFSYAKFEIMLNNKYVLESISSSARISILNLKNTVRLYFMIFLLNIRVIFTLLIFLIFPILIALSAIYITSQIFLFIAIAILVILFIILIIILSYLAWVLEIFTTSLWYFSYLEWKRRVDEMWQHSIWE